MAYILFLDQDNFVLTKYNKTEPLYLLIDENIGNYNYYIGCVAFL